MKDGKGERGEEGDHSSNSNRCAAQPTCSFKSASVWRDDTSILLQPGGSLRLQRERHTAPGSGHSTPRNGKNIPNAPRVMVRTSQITVIAPRVWQQDPANSSQNLSTGAPAPVCSASTLRADNSAPDGTLYLSFHPECVGLLSSTVRGSPSVACT